MRHSPLLQAESPPGGFEGVSQLDLGEEVRVGGSSAVYGMITQTMPELDMPSLQYDRWLVRACPDSCLEVLRQEEADAWLQESMREAGQLGRKPLGDDGDDGGVERTGGRELEQQLRECVESDRADPMVRCFSRTSLFVFVRSPSRKIDALLKISEEMEKHLKVCLLFRHEHVE